jgi:hypothetical protein
MARPTQTDHCSAGGLSRSASSNSLPAAVNSPRRVNSKPRVVCTAKEHQLSTSTSAVVSRAHSSHWPLDSNMAARLLAT